LLRLLEPERGQAVEDLALERDGGEDPVESAEPVGGDHHDPIALRVVVAYLAPVELAQEGEIGLAQRVRKLGAQGLVHCGSSGTAQDSACAVAIRPQPAAQLAEHRRRGASAGEYRRWSALDRRTARLRSRASG